MKINTVEFMYEESCYKSSTSKYGKSNSNINISKISHLPFDMLCFHLKNDDTVLNALEIVEYHETTPVSEQFKWNDEKEKKVRHVY